MAAAVPLAMGDTMISVVVTGEDGTTATYSVTVTRLAMGTMPMPTPVPMVTPEPTPEATPEATPEPTPEPTPAPAPAPAAAAPAPRAAAPAPEPTPDPVIGRTGSATATVLDGDVLQIVRNDGGATLNIGIGWIATNDSSQVLVGFIRDAGLGQTYAIVRREDDGKVVRRWVEPGSADVFVVPWADVIANYTVPTDVIIVDPA